MRNALRYVAVRWRITDQPVLCAEKMRTHRAALPEKEVVWKPAAFMTETAAAETTLW